MRSKYSIVAHSSFRFLDWAFNHGVFYIFGGQILGKAEFLNPGGSVKDRVAVKIIEEVSKCLIICLFCFPSVA